MDRGSIEQHVDAIYEAAVVPELWPRVFDEIAHSIGMMGGGVMAAPSYVPPLQPKIVPTMRWICSPAVEDLFNDFFKNGWAMRCPLTAGGRALQRPFFLTDTDVVGQGGFNRMATFEFYRRHGVGAAAGLFLSMPTGDFLTFSFERRLGAGPIEPGAISSLEVLRPHLTRAALIASRLGLERASAAAQALSIIGLPALVIGANRTIAYMNEAMNDYENRPIHQRAFGHFGLGDDKADALLDKALAAVARRQEGVFSLPIPQTPNRSAVVVHLVPIRGTARDLFASASCILALTPILSKTLPAAGIIKGLFDLTEAEARIARMIASGNTISDIASKSGTTEGTVRSQLKQVFAKTGVHRQAELVGLLGATALA